MRRSPPSFSVWSAASVFLLQMVGAADSLVLNFVVRPGFGFDTGTVCNLIPYFFYAAAGVALFALSKPLARLAARGIGYD